MEVGDHPSVPLDRRIGLYCLSESEFLLLVDVVKRNLVDPDN